MEHQLGISTNTMLNPFSESRCMTQHYRPAHMGGATLNNSTLAKNKKLKIKINPSSSGGIAVIPMAGKWEILVLFRIGWVKHVASSYRTLSAVPTRTGVSMSSTLHSADSGKTGVYWSISKLVKPSTLLEGLRDSFEP